MFVEVVKISLINILYIISYIMFSSVGKLRHNQFSGFSLVVFNNIIYFLGNIDWSSLRIFSIPVDHPRIRYILLLLWFELTPSVLSRYLKHPLRSSTMREIPRALSNATTPWDCWNYYEPRGIQTPQQETRDFSLMAHFDTMGRVLCCVYASQSCKPKLSPRSIYQETPKSHRSTAVPTAGSTQMCHLHQRNVTGSILASWEFSRLI